MKTSPSSVEELLQILVRIPSVNPEGDPGTSGTGELAMATFLAEFLPTLGASAELREVLPERPNLVARFPSARPEKPRLLFAPHTDTVSVLGMTIEPFCGDLRDGKIFGRGASDTKGPMAAMLWALREERAILGELTHEIWFAGLVSEEAGQHGSKALAREEYFDFVVVGEPTGLQVVHTHKGSAFLHLRTRGRAAHASRPELGENAIEKMLDVLALIRGDWAREAAAIHDPVLGSPTISIGTLRGGSKTNIIPDFCEASVDMRFVPAQFQGGFAEKLRARLLAVCPNLEVDFSPSPPLFTDPEHPLIRLLGECDAPAVGAPWFCDACFFAERGMPAIAIGPGSIHQAHTKDEFMSVEDLRAGVDFFRKFLRKLRESE